MQLSVQLLRQHRLSQDAGDLQVTEIFSRTGDDDDGDVAGEDVARDFLLNDRAADKRQHQVEDDKVGRRAVDAPKRFESVAGFFHVISCESQ